MRRYRLRRINRVTDTEATQQHRTTTEKMVLAGVGVGGGGGQTRGGEGAQTTKGRGVCASECECLRVRGGGGA